MNTKLLINFTVLGFLCMHLGAENGVKKNSLQDEASVKKRRKEIEESYLQKRNKYKEEKLTLMNEIESEKQINNRKKHISNLINRHITKVLHLSHGGLNEVFIDKNNRGKLFSDLRSQVYKNVSMRITQAITSVDQKPDSQNEQDIMNILFAVGTPLHSINKIEDNKQSIELASLNRSIFNAKDPYVAIKDIYGLTSLNKIKKLLNPIVESYQEKLITQDNLAATEQYRRVRIAFKYFASRQLESFSESESEVLFNKIRP